MKKESNYEVDVVVVGSGGGGMTAALMAHDLGCKTLLLEKSASYGGTTAMSGGAIWVPGNHFQQQCGIEDSAEQALAYLKSVTRGEVAETRLKAYVEHAPEMIRYLHNNSSVRFRLVSDYPDYYPEYEGSMNQGGRTLEAIPFYDKSLGDEKNRMMDFHAQGAVLGKLMMSVQDSHPILQSHLAGRTHLGKQFLSYLANPARFLSRVDSRRTMGNALIGRLRLSLLQRQVPLLLNTAARELINDGQRIVGVIAEQESKKIVIKANKGVIFAAGGFEKNLKMREAFQEQPINCDWSMGHYANEGDAIEIGCTEGASVSLMDDAWWMPVIMIPGKIMPWYIKGAWWESSSREGKDTPWFVMIERSLPGCIFVNSKGRRFTNEAVNYVDFVKNQRASHRQGDEAVPAYMIADQRFHMRYPFGPAMWGFPMKKYIESGHIVVADTIEALAEKLKIDKEALVDEVSKNNAYAQTGKDLDYEIGATKIQRYFADEAVSPNPCLAPIDKPPFYAIRVYPGDIGTKGGLDTNESAQVLRKDGSVIEGLYAAGNCSSSVMGRAYPGAGGTIGPAMTFGYIAAKHAAGF